MMKCEFEAIAKTPITNENYKKLETVYTYHPSISATQGKQQIAYLYDNFGMRMIEDMLPTAKKAQELQEAIRCKRMEIEMMTAEYERFCNGFEY